MDQEERIQKLEDAMELITPKGFAEDRAWARKQDARITALEEQPKPAQTVTVTNGLPFTIPIAADGVIYRMVPAPDLKELLEAAKDGLDELNNLTNYSAYRKTERLFSALKRFEAL